jgi:type III secretion protein T
MELINTDPYLSFFLNRGVSELWTLLLLCMGRIIPIVAFTPFLGGKILPDTMKIGFGVALSPIFLPMLITHSAGTPLALDVVFMALLVKEILIGSFIGMLISIPFHFAQSAGSLIDHQSGSQSLQVTDPSTQAQATPTGVLYNNMMIVTFFFVGGPILFFEAIFTSYKVMPADQFFSPEFFSHTTPLFLLFVKLLNALVTITVQLSAPSVIAMLLSDLFLGIANRMAPQVQISFLLWSLKSFLGIGMVWVGWWFILKQLDIQGLAWVKMMQKVIQTIKI